MSSNHGSVEAMCEKLAIDVSHIIRSGRYKGKLLFERQAAGCSLESSTVLGIFGILATIASPRGASIIHQRGVAKLVTGLCSHLRDEWTLPLLRSPDIDLDVDDNVVRLPSVTTFLTRTSLMKKWGSRWFCNLDSS